MVRERTAEDTDRWHTIDARVTTLRSGVASIRDTIGDVSNAANRGSRSDLSACLDALLKDLDTLSRVAAELKSDVDKW